jgi:hypothetical protein
VLTVYVEKAEWLREAEARSLGIALAGNDGGWFDTLGFFRESTRPGEA